MSFDGGSGSGYHFGLVGEYFTKESNWAGVLNISLVDKRFAETSAASVKDSIFRYRNESELTYVTFSPGVKYNFMEEGLFLFSAIDLSIALSNDSKILKQFESSERISEVINSDFQELQPRLALQLGIGYDILMADVTNSGRIRFTPYFSFATGTKILSDHNSSWNSFVGRVGVQIKFGFDRIKRDTLEFNPEAERPPVFLASVKNETGVEFPDFEPLRNPPTADLAFVPVSMIEKETVTESNIEASLPAEVEEPQAPEINLTGPRRFAYPTSSAVGITPEIQNYLDEVVRYLKANPGTEVRIVGHSDNTGTLVQNTQRSQQRAQRVEDYIRSKGIPNSVIYTTGRGALSPIAPINTPEGRSQNRRVEITILQ